MPEAELHSALIVAVPHAPVADAGMHEHERRSLALDVVGELPADGSEAEAHKGMLPCLRFGFGSRFVNAVSRAEMSTGRVRRGRMTSST